MTDSLGRRAFLSLSGGAVLMAAGRTGLEAGATSHRDFTKQADDDAPPHTTTAETGSGGPAQSPLLVTDLHRCHAR